MLNIHPASAEEREVAYRNVHDVWSAGLPIEEHVRRRLASPKHRRASWFVGCAEGRVATALGSYAVDFLVNGQTIPGMAIGSVHTLAKFRGRGFASQLLPWVEAHERKRGVNISLLYSDVPAAFYERLGYVTCPSFVGWADPDSTASESLRAAAHNSLSRFDPIAELEQMAKLYADFHGKARISIARSTDYWRHLLERQPNEEFYWLTLSRDALAAYVCLTVRGDTLKIGDFALTSQDQDLERRLYEAVIELGRKRGMKRVGGWLPRTDVTEELFGIARRHDEITMLKALEDTIRLDTDSIALTDRFCEIDHV